MKAALRPVELTQAFARPVLTIHIDIEQFIAAVRRHVPLDPMPSRSIRNDFIKLFNATRITVR